MIARPLDNELFTGAEPPCGVIDGQGATFPADWRLMERRPVPRRFARGRKPVFPPRRQAPGHDRRPAAGRRAVSGLPLAGEDRRGQLI